MFEKKRSVVAKGAKLTGQLSIDGSVELKGEVEGEVIAASIDVLPGAVVVGPIEAKKIVVNGTVNGAIRGSSVLLKSRARVTGDIDCGSLVVEKGASIEGRLQRGFGASESEIEDNNRRIDQISSERSRERAVLSQREENTVLAEEAAEADFTNGRAKPRANGSSQAATSS
ncbi:MAG: polymer-forming cytoskeletal protein [Methyloceanibacter sp.]|nr:polymer-forming cytoskeletal protein [Methyloceanibacter sp.]